MRKNLQETKSTESLALGAFGKIKGFQTIVCGQPKNIAVISEFTVAAILLRLTFGVRGDEKVLRCNYIITLCLRSLMNIVLSKSKLLLYFL